MGIMLNLQINLGKIDILTVKLFQSIVSLSIYVGLHCFLSSVFCTFQHTDPIYTHS